MDQDAWDAMRKISQQPEITERRPSVGRRVRVIDGRQLGIEGTVTWHGRDKFSRTSRYGNPMAHALRDVIGLRGWRVRVQPDGDEAFFINAEKVCVL